MTDTAHIVAERIAKLERHMKALESYKILIDRLASKKDVYSPDQFEALRPEDKAIFDAYLKRFSSVQDYLGAKIFPAILELAGIGAGPMSAVLSLVEKEGIIDDLETWVRLRETRNHLEHDYPAELAQALQDLHFCVEQFTTLQSYYERVISFVKRYGLR